MQDLECGSSRSAAKLKHFFYDGKGISIVMPGIGGIPEWIKYQKMGSGIKIELPMNWHEDKNLLGFVLCYLYVPVEVELEFEKVFLSEPINRSDDESIFDYALFCELSMNGFKDSLCFHPVCTCYKKGPSDLVWLLYYPKIGIQEEYRSNQWRNLEVEFYVHVKRAEKEKCGFCLIYDQEDESAAADTNVYIKRSHEDAENNPGEDPFSKWFAGPHRDRKI